MTYRIHYGVLRTGGEISELPVASCSFGDEIRSTGSFQAQVALGQCGNGALWQATRGAYTFWAAEWYDQGGRRIVAGGPVFARKGDDDTGIAYGGSNMYAMMSHRKLMDQTWTDAQISTGTLTYSSLDLGSTIAAIVAQVTTTPPADLPIVFEAPRSGTHTGVYSGYEVAWAADKMVELGNVESGTGGLGGPDWMFTPRFLAGDFTRVEWVLTTGTATQPTLTQTGPVVTLDKGAPNQQNVGSVTISEDAAKLSTTAIATNSAAEKTKIIVTATDATLTNAGYPRLDGESPTISNSTVAAQVTALAQGQLTRTQRSPDALTVEVNAGWWWAQGGGTGTTVRLIDPSNPVFGPIDITSRVIKWDVQDISSEWVTLTLADSLGGV